MLGLLGQNPILLGFVNAYLTVKHACWYAGVSSALDHGVTLASMDATMSILSAIDNKKQMKSFKNGSGGVDKIWVF